mgnify:CR=1 FL=1
MKNVLSIISLLFINFFNHAQEIKMSGQVVDLYTQNPIEFVNIGILNKNLGIRSISYKFNKKSLSIKILTSSFHLCVSTLS